MTVDIAVVIVTYNSERHVLDLLASLPQALGELSSSVVIVDNGSSDATVALLESRSDCVVVRSTNTGFAAGVNLAIRSSPQARALLVVNPDATLDPGSVPAMLAVLDRPGVGIVVPRVREQDGSLSPSLRRDPTLPRVGGLSFTGLSTFAERVDDPSFYEDEHEIDWAMGAIMLVAPECYAAVGGLDESFFLYSEETDFFLRSRDAGWLSVYTPDAGAMHVGGGSGESAATHTMQMLNRVRLYRRRTDAVRASVYFVLTVLVELRRAVLGGGRSWRTLGALLWPPSRPAVLGACRSLLPR